MIESIILTVLSGVSLLLYKLYDPNKDMQRHFHQNEKAKYYLLQFAVISLTLSLMFHGRHVVWFCLKHVWNKIFWFQEILSVHFKMETVELYNKDYILNK